MTDTKLKGLVSVLLEFTGKQRYSLSPGLLFLHLINTLIMMANSD